LSQKFGSYVSVRRTLSIAMYWPSVDISLLLWCCVPGGKIFWNMEGEVGISEEVCITLGNLQDLEPITSARI